MVAECRVNVGAVCVMMPEVWSVAGGGALCEPAGVLCVCLWHVRYDALLRRLSPEEQRLTLVPSSSMCF